MGKRIVKTFEEFFDIMDDIGDTKFVNIGYVTGANLNVPKVKRKNPLTNRMKGYDDYSSWGEGIGALVKITNYNFQYRSSQKFAEMYGKYKADANAIRAKYGIEPIKDKENDYKEKMDYGKSGVYMYKGGNEEKMGHSYRMQNVHGAPKISSTVYAVDTEGHIIRALDDETEVRPYVKKKAPISGVNALRNMGRDEETIKAYVAEIEALGFKPHPFEASSLLFAVATVNGEKIIYINQKLQRTVNDINIQPEDFIQIVKEKYSKALQESIRMDMKGKTLIRLTESDIHRLVKESVKRILRESSEDLWDQIDAELSKFGDVSVSRFYSDDDQITLAAEKRTYRKASEWIVSAMRRFNYALYDTGENGRYIMMTFRPAMTDMFYHEE